MNHWNLDGETVILRVDFNVPIKNGVITDDTRIVKSLDTVNALLKSNAKLIIMSHLGRPLKELLPDGSIDFAKFSLQPIAKKLGELLNINVHFAKDCGGPDTLRLLAELKSGEILLLENTRFNKQEEKGDLEWAKSLSTLGEYYVNDAFGSAHREHCSTATIARFFDKEHKSFGLLMDAEVKNASKVMDNPERPFTAILGGAKVSDKINLISSLIDRCDNILIGGGMAFTFFAAKGILIGKSLCESDKLDLAKSLLQKAHEKNVKIFLPLDSVAADSFSNEAKYYITNEEEIHQGFMGLDIGSQTIEKYNEIILASKTIVWNGPMGVFEMSNFSNGTKQIALSVANATAAGAFSLIGGGDSVAAINKYELSNQVSFISTGGGAMLEFLEGKELPGIAAMNI
ncbi:MAG: phosphoglycerate kinase [Saprospiraceae bacterium]|nr:phosphoglycerate kinase [Saprospiraceae bacterium]